MSAITATQEEFEALFGRVQELIEAQDSYILDRDLLKTANSLEKLIENIDLKQTKLTSDFIAIREAHNALSFRFRKLATNEETLNNAAAVIPTQDEKDALAGTLVGLAPSGANPYITDDDLRLSDSRTPNAHAISHEIGGTDLINHDLLTGANGFRSHTDIDDLLDAHVTAISDLVTLTGTQGTAITDLETFETNLTLDNLPLGVTYVKVTPAEQGLFLSSMQYAQVDGTSVDPLDNFLTTIAANLLYQPVGTYIDDTYFDAIPKDFIPDIANVRSLGSALKPWAEIYVSGNTIYVGGKSLSIIDNELALDGVKVVNVNTVTDEINANTNVIAAKDHADVTHDWDFIRGNTIASLPSATALNNFITTHVGSGDHNALYFTKAEINAGTPTIFNSYATIANLTAGTIDVDWSSLTNIPVLANNKFKGTVTTFNDLPIGSSNIAVGEVYFVNTNPNKSTLSAAYLVVDPYSANRSVAYRPIFNPNEFSHANITGLTADDHAQYYNATRLQSYVTSPGFISQIKSDIGILSTGSGHIITDTERTRLTYAYNHALMGSGNPHNVTAAQIGALQNIAGAVKKINIDFGTVNANQVNTDSIPEGTNNMWANAQLFDDVANALAIANDDSLHFDSVGQKNNLIDGGETTLHYHASDRNLGNATGVLPIAKVSGLEAAIAALAQIIDLDGKSHDEYHTLASHDTDVTGVQLDNLQTLHAVIKNGHNAEFSISGGDNGASTRIARQDHIHSTYLLKTTYQQLSDTLGGSTQKVHWSNLIGVPQTVGNARVFPNAAALAAATPVILGEQVVVTDHDGLGNWGVYIGIDLVVAGWSLLSSENLGLSYAAANHDHDADYMPLSGGTMETTIETVINNYFGTPTPNRNIPSDAAQTGWNTTSSEFTTHKNNNDLHVTAPSKTEWDTAYTHSQTGGIHLTTGEKTIISTFPASVKSTDITSNTVTQSLQQWIDLLSTQPVLNMEDLNDWPSHINATAINFEKLFNGTALTGFHTHIEHADEVHSHDATTDLVNLDTAIGDLDYLKQAGVVNLFTSQVITTTQISEGSNKYLTEGNLLSINTYSGLLAHMADQNTNEKHLSDGQKNALVSGLTNPTDLHSHNGHHYIIDGNITIGTHRPSVSNPTPVGEAGLIKAPRIAVTAAAPSAGNDPGQNGEIRISNGFIFAKCPDGTWRKATLISL